MGLLILFYIHIYLSCIHLIAAKAYYDNSYSEIINRFQNFTSTYPNVIKWKENFENITSALPEVKSIKKKINFR